MQLGIRLGSLFCGWGCNNCNIFMLPNNYLILPYLINILPRSSRKTCHNRMEFWHMRAVKSDQVAPVVPAGQLEAGTTPATQAVPLTADAPVKLMNLPARTEWWIMFTNWPSLLTQCSCEVSAWTNGLSFVWILWSIFLWWICSPYRRTPQERLSAGQRNGTGSPATGHWR